MAQTTTTQKVTRRKGTAPRSGDATGRKAAELEAKIAEEREAQEKEERAQRKQAAEERDEVVDLTGKSPLPDEVVVVDEADEEPLTDDELLERIQQGDTDPSLMQRFVRRFKTYKSTVEQDVIDSGITVYDDDTAVIRIAEDVDKMTYGTGNHMSFKAGQRYRVPQHLADHLEEKGLIWH